MEQFSNWEKSVRGENLEYLVKFLKNTKNKTKEHYVCVLFGNNNKVNNVVDKIINYINNENDVAYDEIKSFKMPLTNHNKKLIIINNPMPHEFDDCVPHIKEYLSDHIIYRRPYTIQTSANIIITTDCLSFFDYFTPETAKKFKVVQII